MAVKSKEDGSVIRSVLQDDHRPVVQGCLIVGEDMDSTGQWSVDGRTRFGKEINADMDDTALIRQARSRGEEWGGIEQARFIIAANCEFHAGRPHRAE